MPNTRFYETLKCLKQTSANTYELTEPHLLYLSGDQSQAYLKAMDDEAYSGTFHNATVNPVFNNNRVELRFQIRAPVMSGHVPLKTGDVVVTAISYRYTRESWQQLLKIHFDDFDLYDSQDGNTVVACCLRSNGMMQHHKL